MSLRISSELELPLDVAGEAIALLATRGAGKSYTSAVLVEELYAAGVQTIVLDPTGVYWGLRGAGEKDGLPLYVFGGAHGDVPLEPTAGTLFADLAVDEEQSFVLDLSDFPAKADQTKFVTAFAERLYRRKARARTTTHLVIDEADEFAPQRTMGNLEPRMLGAMEALVRRGRSRGLGVTLITQRSAALNKNVLDLVETLIVLRTLGPRDRKAIEGWVSIKDLSDELGVLDSLPSLPTGTGWVWSPVRGILEKVAIRTIRTFDSYRTPKPGETRAEPKEIAPIDLDSLGEKIRATAEKARAEDPRALRKEIAALKAELAKRPTEEAVREVMVEVPTAVFNGEIERLEQIHHNIHVDITAIATFREEFLRTAEMVESAVAKAKGVTAVATVPRAAIPRVERAPRPRRAEPRPARAPADDQGAAGDFAPSGPEQKILDALAWLYSVGIAGDRKRVAFLAGYRQSGTFAGYLSGLSTAGAISYPGPGAVALTELGSSFATHPDVPPTSEDIQEMVLEKLSGPQQRILRELLAAYPNALEREVLAEATGYQLSGTFAGYLSGLSTIGVITYPSPGTVAADPVLFIE
jgi:hypothetical protein